MTDFIEIQSSIVKKIYDKVPNIEINSSDIEEGFERPSFYVEMQDVESENLMDKYQEKKIEFEILYFPEDPKKNIEDLLKARSLLNDIFVGDPTIKIHENLITEAEDVRIFSIDKVLHCKFIIRIAEEYAKTYEYTMEDLEFKEVTSGNK